MSEEPKHWRTAPRVDEMLAWYFNDAEAACGFTTTHQAFLAMAQSGVSQGGNTTTDDRLVQKSIVTLTEVETFKPPARMADGSYSAPDPSRRDHRGSAGKLRTIETALRGLSLFDRKVLRGAYRRHDRKSMAKDDVERLEKRLGWLSNVMLLDPENEVLSGPLDVRVWLATKATENQVLAAHGRALILLRLAWNRFADARGRRPRAERHANDREMFEKFTRPRE